MTRETAPGEKPLIWIGPSLRDLKSFPAEAQGGLGLALSTAQCGGKHPAVQSWEGEGPGVLEIVEDHDGDTFRAIYRVRFARAVYVLHAFQKKSPKVIETRQSDIVLVRERLKAAQRSYDNLFGGSK
jgi:phage-related protein